MNPFATALLAWFDEHGRKDLPWQHPRDAYRVWLSEVMLQQTQVATVIPYFQRFVAALPSLRDLAAADEDTVLALWSGLGYYRRARFLQRAAQICVERHHGELPRDFEALADLPGIGRSTAGAILAQAHGLRFPILDGNVKRVLTRYLGIHGHPGQSAVEKVLWQHADAFTPAERTADYTQAIMDLGATLCVRSKPRCDDCPVASGCIARRDGLTAQLPSAKPGKAVPTRDTVMLILRDAKGRVLLERRGPQGVWSGLWSLPEASDHDHAWRTAETLAKIDDAQSLPSFVHVFSHYRLKVEPLLFDEATAHRRIADNPGIRWCGPDERDALGLPAPVRTLLQNL
ncbi:A/G-specific DNA-adenine glycosylase [Dyella jiangningensis]|uniref:A/G-specific adenine glycosylase n=1 Tax=Dyella sp. AtDHG13 TaxID=1938897 RepID=UPI0008906FB2|nr:A/G-specific adenine glycosylase [Dyella sp. AtDHG13]PXV52088.1 A/G-specific DNA-adenine glycosylase [Dyella sp. AtDHG13]SDL55871.1 A/G-specific DNA-adenine glycosylase [Dyella jiangningensis]